MWRHGANENDNDTMKTPIPCKNCGLLRERDAEEPLPHTTCSRIRITLEITDPEVVEDYKDICDDLVWKDLVNGELINFAEFVSRENETSPSVGATEKDNDT